MTADQQYLALLYELLTTGVTKGDRTGVGTLSLFGRQMRFDLKEGFPLLTTKRIHVKSVIYELLWFLQGGSNVGYLKDHGVTIWNEWADPETGELGPIYGTQWRSWPGPDGQTIDQMTEVLEQIKTNPESRRMLVSAWNVGCLNEMSLPPCHVLFQFYVAEKQLSLHLYQRSADMFIGVPFNIASYALLLLMVSQVTGLEAGEFIHTFGDVHLYQNHIEQAALQLKREPKSAPTMVLTPDVDDLYAFTYEDCHLIGYEPHPGIKAAVAV